MNTGSVVIWIAAVLAAFAVLSAFGWSRRRSGVPTAWERAFRWSYAGMTAALLAAAVLLLKAILTHDFRYDYVIDYSSRDLPRLYLFSAFWGGQEGTYLLWALFGALLGYALFRKRAWQPAAVMAAYTPTVAILIAYMLNPGGNPFRLAPVVPPDGRGLNPLLQDPWMAAHPPIVFLGYAAVTIPAVLAWVAAFRRQEKEWLGPALRWSLFGFVALGIGIILGGIWAYKVLGWGGFWGWDPVENASLIPWLVITALLHGLLVQRSTGALGRANLILAMAAYLLVVYSTFLTRSGVLADFSVHSFPKGTIYGWLVATLVAVALVSILAQMRRRAPEAPPVSANLAWPFILTTIVVLFSVSALFVLVGTSWPILSSIVGRPATRTAAFYNEVNLPVYILILAVLGLGPFLSWAPLPPGMWLRRFIPSLTAAVAATVVAILLGGSGIGPLALFFVAFLSLASNFIRFVEVARRRFLLAGAAIAHMGFALMFVGIVAGESWDHKVELALPAGRPVPALGRVLTFQGHVPGSGPRDRWRVSVETPGGPTQEADLTFYRLENGQIFKKPSIFRRITGDFYLAPSSISFDKPEGETLELAKNEQTRYDGTALTFRRYANMRGGMGGGMSMDAVLEVTREGQTQEVSLPLTAGPDGLEGTPVPVPALGGATLTLTGMSVESGTIEVLVGPAEQSAGGGAGDAGGTSDAASPSGTLVLEASVKPLISLLWAGTVLLSLGCIVAFIRRTLEAREGVPAPTATGREALKRVSFPR